MLCLTIALSGRPCQDRGELQPQPELFCHVPSHPHFQVPTRLHGAHSLPTLDRKDCNYDHHEVDAT